MVYRTRSITAAASRPVPTGLFCKKCVGKYPNSHFVVGRSSEKFRRSARIRNLTPVNYSDADDDVEDAHDVDYIEDDGEEVEMDFDAASRAWRANKVPVGNGCYVYK